LGDHDRRGSPASTLKGSSSTSAISPLVHRRDGWSETMGRFVCELARCKCVVVERHVARELSLPHRKKKSARARPVRARVQSEASFSRSPALSIQFAQRIVATNARQTLIRWQRKGGAAACASANAQPKIAADLTAKRARQEQSRRFFRCPRSLR
jgi:hypothetical protein